MSQVIRIPEELYRRIEKYAQGFDTPANVIEMILNFYEAAHGAAMEKKPLPSENLPASSSDSLEIIYYPNGEAAFKKALLDAKQAYVRLDMVDGTSDVRVWQASKFTPSSDVNNNLRSGYLREWKKKGIYRAIIAIDKNDIAKLGI